MSALSLREFGQFVRFEAAPDCSWAKHILLGRFVDSLGEWRLDPRTASWTEGLSQKTSKDAREETARTWAHLLAPERGLTHKAGATRGAFVFGRYMVAAEAGAIVIASRLKRPALGDLDLDFWREAFAEKTWLVEFSADLSLAIIYCPCVVPTAHAVKTILAALDDAVDLAEAILSVFETHPDAARTWQVWFAAGTPTLFDRR